MNRLAIAALTLALTAAACTNSSADTTTTELAPTTSVTPLTTLVPPPTTTTTLPPTTTTQPPVTNECVVGANTTVTPYTQGCETLTLPILAGADVDPEAVSELADRMFNMLAERPDLTAAIIAQGVEARVIGADERLTDLPEYVDLYELYPGTDWDRTGRSFPGTELVPYVAGGEENLLCWEDDRYQGEDMFIRDMALAIRRFGMFVADPSTSARIEQAYATAIAQGLWRNTLAEINSDSYWAEGVQSYFDANLEEPDDRPPNSSHNQVDTRDELRVYDRDLYLIAQSVFGDTEWRPCAAETS